MSIIKDYSVRLADKYWIKKPVILKCSICGSMISPFFSKIGPYEGYGWLRLKDGRFICHNCFYHYDSYTRKEKEELIYRINEDVLSYYKKFKEAHKGNKVYRKKVSYGYRIIIK